MKLCRYKHDSPVSYAFGATLAYELLKVNPRLATRIFLRPNIKHGKDLEDILSKISTQNIPIIESAKPFNILGAKANCLLIAEFNKPTTSLRPTPKEPHLILVNPSDAGNLGTIIRTAVAFNYNNLAIITPAVDHFDPKVIRASMGAIFHINIETFSYFDEYLTKYANDSATKRTLYSFMLDQNATQLANISPESANFALIFGNEASGLPKEYATKTNPVYIPQTPLVDSLNLSIAAGIAMYSLQPKNQ